MRAVIQRVTSAAVEIDQLKVAEIGTGLLILVGFEEDDSMADVEWLSRKIARLRVFNDTSGIMNLNVSEVCGRVLVVSQFTLHASTKKGNRPSYIRAARPDTAIPLYQYFIEKMELDLGQQPLTGKFGADMKVSLLNDGPVTIIIDTKWKE